MTPCVLPGNTHVYAQYTIRIPDRDGAAQRLKAQGIPTAVYYPKCLHEQPVFASLGYKYGDFPESEKAAGEVISLPMHPFLTEADLDRVVAAVARFEDRRPEIEDRGSKIGDRGGGSEECRVRSTES